MTVLTDNSSISYVGDGIETVYPYDFNIPTSSEALVTLDNSPTLDYSISGLGDPNGGTVTFDVAPDNLVDIVISRLVEYTQETDYRAYDAFPAEVTESTFDRLVFQIQQLARDLTSVLTGAFTKSPDTPSDVSTVVPAPIAGYFWKWASDGKSVEAADITSISGSLVPVATDGEIVAGVETQTRLLSPFQAKLSVQTHETGPVTSVFDSLYHEVVDVLPVTPDPNKIYLVRN